MPVHNTGFNKDLQIHTACRNTQRDVHIYTPGLVTVSSQRQLGIRWEIMFFFCSSAHGAYQLLHMDFRFLWSNSFLWINPGLYLCFSPQVHTQSPAMSVRKSSSSYIVNISILRQPPLIYLNCQNVLREKHVCKTCSYTVIFKPQICTALSKTMVITKMTKLCVFVCLYMCKL